MPWIAGQQLQGGKYVIEKVLGQGGFGITYKALQVGLNRLVVIKTPNEFLSYDPEYQKYVERFLNEGIILARLSQEPHPHIVGVIDLFQEGNTHCLVMEFVEGENLFEAVNRRGALPEAEIVPYIKQIGEALTMVHRAGLVHRDAHPGNIMLRSNGKAVLIDFGIAKELLPQSLSSTGNVGNKGFAPYEQMTRGSREPTVDVYCLTATLYYALTGQPPINSLARKLENTLLQSPKKIIPSISNRLNQAILKGMALEAKDRPHSMQAWLAMLEDHKQSHLASVDLFKIKEFVQPKAKFHAKAVPDNSVFKQSITIFWEWISSFFRNISLIWINSLLSLLSHFDKISPDKLNNAPLGLLTCNLVMSGLLGYFLAGDYSYFYILTVVFIIVVITFNPRKYEFFITSNIKFKTLFILVTTTLILAVKMALGILIFIRGLLKVEYLSMLWGITISIGVTLITAALMYWANKNRIMGSNWNPNIPIAVTASLFLLTILILVASSVVILAGHGLGVVIFTFIAYTVLGVSGFELRKKLKQINSFLILACTYFLGLSLGWLFKHIFNTIS